MSYTYATFVTALADEMVVSESDTSFVSVLPRIIEEAESRCYRELDLLAATVTTAGTLTANNRSFTLPTTNGHVLTVDFIRVTDSSSVFHTVSPASRAVIETLYPSNTAGAATDIPEFFARISDTEVLLGPSPGSSWSCNVVHSIRPAALASGNTTTYLTNYLPDLFFAAAMVRACAHQKNFGSMADDPQMAVSWEGHYQTLLASSKNEETRKRYVRELSTPGRN